MNLMPAIALDPIKQFQVTKWIDLKVGTIDISFTNASGFMLLGVALVIALFGMAARKGELVPSRLQSVAEIGFGFVADMIRGTAGEEGLRFFPFVFTLFFFILFANLIGMVPYAFTTTSHIIVTGTLALTVILMVVAVGLIKNGLGFFKLFVPSGVPFFVLPLVVVIEIISFLVRPVTLALRLFGNMVGGHVVLKVFGGFVVSLGALGALGVVGALVTLTGTVAITALEFMVAFLQAFVFAVLACVYLNDVVNLHSH